PDEIFDKVPNSTLPFIYTGIIYLIIEKYQGIALKEHKEHNKPFYSAWKATGVGAVCMVILFGGIIAYTFLGPTDFDTDRYDKGIAEFTKNEEKALHLFSIIETSS